MKVLYGPSFYSYKAESYDALFGAMRQAGHDPEFVPIPWDHAEVLGAWTAAWRRAYEPCDPKNTIVGAFSAGNVSLLHMVSQLPADRQPRGILSCSLSPYFREDRLWERYEGMEEIWGSNITPVFKRLSFAAMAQHVACPVELIAGTEEKPWLQDRVADASHRLARATVTQVPGVRHPEAIDHPDYIAATVARLQILAAA